MRMREKCVHYTCGIEHTFVWCKWLTKTAVYCVHMQFDWTETNKKQLIVIFFFRGSFDSLRLCIENRTAFSFSPTAFLAVVTVLWFRCRHPDSTSIAVCSSNQLLYRLVFSFLNLYTRGELVKSDENSFRVVLMFGQTRQSLIWEHILARIRFKDQYRCYVIEKLISDLIHLDTRYKHRNQCQSLYQLTFAFVTHSDFAHPNGCIQENDRRQNQTKCMPITCIDCAKALNIVRDSNGSNHFSTYMTSTWHAQLPAHIQQTVSANANIFMLGPHTLYVCGRASSVSASK